MSGNMAMAAIEVRFGEATYNMSPLTDRDRRELDHWVQAEFLATAKIAAGEPDSDHYDAVMRIALQEAPSLTWTRYPGARIMATPHGVARLAWQGIKKNHPQTSFDDIIKAMSTIEGIREFREKYAIVNDIKSKETKGPVPLADPTPSRNSTPSSS